MNHAFATSASFDVADNVGLAGLLTPASGQSLGPSSSVRQPPRAPRRQSAVALAAPVIDAGAAGAANYSRALGLTSNASAPDARRALLARQGLALVVLLAVAAVLGVLLLVALELETASPHPTTTPRPHP